MYRFYTEQKDINLKRIILSNQDELHHLKDVLRAKSGNKIQLFNNNGQEVTGKIINVTIKNITIEKISFKQDKNNSTRIILACAMPKKSKFETIIEKATEFGITEIIPVETKRTEVKIKSDQIDRKRKRFETVAINAAKQSKRLSIPVIHPVMKFEKTLDYLLETSTVIIPSLNEHSQKLIDTLQKHKKTPSIAFLIGPEGDFTSQEYILAQEKGCLPVTLGPTVLKVETAAFCVCSAANLILTH